jgi:hypothetical protein
MVGLTKYVLRVWEISVAIQIVVCGVLFFKGNFRKLPVFTAYVLSNICQAGALYLVYRQFGFSSRVALAIGWLSQCVPQLLRVLAITEVLRLILRPYRGIWGLGWRLLVVAFGAVFSVALIDSWRDRFFAIGLADRGFHLAFGVALVACLLLVHYYSVPIHPAYKALLGGFCFYSCIAVMANTIGMSRLHQGNSNFRDAWQLLTMGAFVAVLVVWGVALRTPLPQAAQPRSLPGAERTYWEMSPQINERLRRLNERLDHFWKSEAIQQ